MGKGRGGVEKQSVILASDLASEWLRRTGAWQQLSCGNRIEVGRNFGNLATWQFVNCTHTHTHTHTKMAKNGDLIANNNGNNLPNILACVAQPRGEWPHPLRFPFLCGGARMRALLCVLCLTVISNGLRIRPVVCVCECVLPLGLVI